MDSALPYICVSGAAFVVTFLTVPLAKAIATRLGAIDYPSARRINTRPTPRMGGIAVFLGLAAALIVQYAGTKLLGWPPALVPHPRMEVNYPVLALSVAIIFATGVADDVLQLRARMKLAGQAAAAIVAVAGGLVIAEIVNPFVPGANIELGLLAYPITLVYLVAFTNIINLIDGLDGLATGISAIAALSMFSFALLARQADAAALSIALAAACLAFLRYNFHPASIFLGDSGSLLLGFLLGVVSLLSVSRTAALTSLLIPLIVAGVPIIDTFSAIVRRTRAHVSVGVADKGHIHHRLIRSGFNQRQAVLIIYAWCILLALGAVTINQVGIAWRVGIFAMLALGSLVVALKLHLFEPVLRHHYNPKTHKDVLVTPDDPAFAEEERRAAEQHRHLPALDLLAAHAPANTSQDTPAEKHEARQSAAASSGTHADTPDTPDTHAKE